MTGNWYPLPALFIHGPLCTWNQGQNFVLYDLLIHQFKAATYLLYKDEMLSVCPSVCIFASTHIALGFLHVLTPDLLKMQRPSFQNTHAVHFKMFLIRVVCHLRRFECQGVDDSCQNFTYIPAKLQPRHN